MYFRLDVFTLIFISFYAISKWKTPTESRKSISNLQNIGAVGKPHETFIVNWNYFYMKILMIKNMSHGKKQIDHVSSQPTQFVF